ncbi:MAG: SPOR domain-containing protein, partial [Candidatus Omnitrophota bacterium]
RGTGRLSNAIAGRRKPRNVVLPVEAVLFVAIVVVLGFIFSFAVGVETGKRRSSDVAYAELAETVYVSPDKDDLAELPGPAVQDVSRGASRDASLPQIPAPETTEKTAKPVDMDAQKPYTIQLISYREKSKAEAKANELKKAGKPAMIIRNNLYYQVCAGSYRDRKDAEKDIKLFSEKYKGCFLRRKDSE